MAEQLDNSEKASLAKLIRLVRMVRDQIDPELPAQTLLAFLEVAHDPGIAQKELEKKLGVASATASRIVSRLSEWEKFSVPGKHLVQSRENPMDRRFMVVGPTPKGLALVRRLVSALQ